MEKFTRYQKKKKELPPSKVAFQGKVKNIIKFDDWEITTEKDRIIVLPYLKDRETILLRHEYIPTFRYRTMMDYKEDKSDGYFLTLISGNIEEGETAEKTLKREIYEESGIVLSSVKQIELEEPLFNDKGNTSKINICLLPLNEGEYRQTIAPGDGSKSEYLSKIVEIPLKDIEHLQCHDLTTKHLLLLLDQYLKNDEEK